MKQHLGVMISGLGEGRCDYDGCCGEGEMKAARTITVVTEPEKRIGPYSFPPNFEERLRHAQEVALDVMTGKRSIRMCIPAQQDDDDLLVAKAFEEAIEFVTEVREFFKRIERVGRRDSAR